MQLGICGIPICCIYGLCCVFPVSVHGCLNLWVGFNMCHKRNSGLKKPVNLSRLNFAGRSRVLDVPLFTPFSDLSCYIMFFWQINYWIQDEEDESMALFNFVEGQRSSGRIIGLRENTFYVVNVQAINSAGNGPKSETYSTRTLRAGW